MLITALNSPAAMFALNTAPDSNAAHQSDSDFALHVMDCNGVVWREKRNNDMSIVRLLILCLLLR